MRFNQGRIQPVTLGGAYSASFRNQVSLQVHHRKRDEVYFITLLRQNNGRQKDLILRMLFSELYKIMVSKVTFPGFRRGDRTPPPSRSAPGFYLCAEGVDNEIQTCV